MPAIQLDFWRSEESCEIDALRLQFNALKKSSDAVRRKLFAEQSPLKKEILELKSRLDILESAICKGQLVYVQKENS